MIKQNWHVTKQVVLGKYFMNCHSYQMHLFVQTYEPGFIMLVKKIYYLHLKAT